VVADTLKLELEACVFDQTTASASGMEPEPYFDQVLNSREESLEVAKRNAELEDTVRHLQLKLDQAAQSR